MIRRSRSFSPNAGRRATLGRASSVLPSSLTSTRRTSALRRTPSFFGNKRGSIARTDSFGRNRRRSAARDPTHFNVLGTDGLVTTERILEHLEHVKDTEEIVKLELEDIVLRKEDQDELVEALQNLATDTFERQWKSIQFTDCIYAFGRDTDEHGTSRAVYQLCEYNEQRQQLKELLEAPPRRNATIRLTSSSLKDHLQAFKDFSGREGSSDFNSLDFSEQQQKSQHTLPIQFQVKLEIHAGTTLDGLLAILRLFMGCSLGSIDYGGALFGYQDRNIPFQLVKLFQKEEGKEEFLLQEMITLHLVYASSEEEEDAKALLVVRQCGRRMAQLRNTGEHPSSEDEEERRKKRRSLAGSSHHSRRSDRSLSDRSLSNRSLSNRSLSNHSLSNRSLSNHSLGDSSDRSRRSDRSLGGSSHHKRRIQRTRSAPTSGIKKPDTAQNPPPLPNVLLLDTEDVDSWPVTTNGEANTTTTQMGEAPKTQVRRPSAKLRRTRSAPTPQKCNMDPKAELEDATSPEVAQKWAAGDSANNTRHEKKALTSQGRPENHENEVAEEKKDASEITAATTFRQDTKKSHRRSRSAPNFPKDSEQQPKLSSEIGQSGQNDVDELLEGTDSLTPMSGESKEGEEEKSTGLTRKKSDASLSSTTHSTGRRHRSKKSRRRSRSLPLLLKERGPPDFRWDKIEQVEVEPSKLTGAAA